MYKNIMLISLLSASSLQSAMIAPVRQLIMIRSFLPETSISQIKTIADQIEEKKLGYNDYDGRTGILWSDLKVKTDPIKTTKEWKDSTKLALIGDKMHKHNPQSILSYPDLTHILNKEILPKTFEFIKNNGWVPALPKKIFAQFFLQRCHTSNVTPWHQDPGEEYDTMADFSLILMLGKQNDPVHGWTGGELQIKAGLPHEEYNERDVKTIVYEYNQAILFNNKLYSHAVTPIFSKENKGKRDLIVITLYLKNHPNPTAVWHG